jgi:hypothetical protein
MYSSGRERCGATPLRSRRHMTMAAFVFVQPGSKTKFIANESITSAQDEKRN